MDSTTSHNKASLWAVGLMLFALFFGAGNLIFPAFLGQQAGENWLSAMFGFLLTGAGLPLLGVIAVGYSGSRDVEALASRVAPWYGVTFATALYLAIGLCLPCRVRRQYLLKLRFPRSLTNLGKHRIGRIQLGVFRYYLLAVDFSR